MFWGYISGKYGKGRGLFWEKEWGIIMTKSYCEYIISILFNYLFNYPRLSYQQDGRAGYNTVIMLALLKS